jgi:hypothetical protein
MRKLSQLELNEEVITLINLGCRKTMVRINEVELDNRGYFSVETGEWIYLV